MPLEIMPPRPGDLCTQDECDGRLVVYKTTINFTTEVRVRHLHCPVCGHLPPSNKWIIPLEYAPPKQKNGHQPKD